VRPRRCSRDSHECDRRRRADRHRGLSFTRAVSSHGTPKLLDTLNVSVTRLGRCLTCCCREIAVPSLQFRLLIDCGDMQNFGRSSSLVIIRLRDKQRIDAFLRRNKKCGFCQQTSHPFKNSVIQQTSSSLTKFNIIRITFFTVYFLSPPP